MALPSPLQVGQIIYVAAAKMWAHQSQGKMIRVSNSPASNDNFRPFLVIKIEPDNSDFFYIIPFTTTKSANKPYLTVVPSQYFINFSGVNNNNSLIHTQVWRVHCDNVNPALDQSYAFISFVNPAFITSTVLPACQNELAKF